MCTASVKEIFKFLHIWTCSESKLVAKTLVDFKRVYVSVGNKTKNLSSVLRSGAVTISSATGQGIKEQDCRLSTRPRACVFNL